MCIQDIQIAKALRTNLYNTVGTLDIPANSRRWSIRIMAQFGENAILYLVNTSIQGNPLLTQMPIGFHSNLPLGPTPVVNNVLTVTLWDIGSAFLGPLQVVSNAAANTYVVETYLDIDLPPSFDMGKLAAAGWPGWQGEVSGR